MLCALQYPLPFTIVHTIHILNRNYLKKILCFFNRFNINLRKAHMPDLPLILCLLQKLKAFFGRNNQIDTVQLI